MKPQYIKTVTFLYFKAYLRTIKWYFENKRLLHVFVCLI